MHYYWGLGSVAVVVLILAIMAYALLRQKKWFLIWLKATIGISFLLIAICLALTLYPMMGFKTLNGEITLAEIKVEKVAEQNFNLKVKIPLERSQVFNFSGDQWVLSTMSLDWMKPLQIMGVQQGYLVSDLESNYLSVMQAKKLKSSKHALTEKNLGYSAWKYLKQYRRALPFLKIEAAMTQPTLFIDGAEYKITYTKLGAKVRPLNNIARGEQATDEEGKVEDNASARLKIIDAINKENQLK